MALVHRRVMWWWSAGTVLTQERVFIATSLEGPCHPFFPPPSTPLKLNYNMWSTYSIPPPLQAHDTVFLSMHDVRAGKLECLIEEDPSIDTSITFKGNFDI